MSNNQFFFYFDIICAAFFFYAAWINLIKKKITRYGFDAWIFIFYSAFFREKVMKYNFRENPSFVQRMGLLTLILGFTFFNKAIVELLTFTKID